MQSESINELTAALLAAQKEMKHALLDGDNSHFKNRYATLASVLDAVKEPLNKNGLALTQETRLTDSGAFTLVTALRHTSGQWIESTYPLPLSGRPQEVGSAITYARRYSLSALCGIASEDDDDGERGSGRGKDPKPVRVTPVVTEPHLIEVPQASGGQAADWVGWGALFVKAIDSATDAAAFQAWLDANAAPLKNMAATADKDVVDRLRKRVADGKAKWLGAA